MRSEVLQRFPHFRSSGELAVNQPRSRIAAMIVMYGIGLMECAWLASDPTYWTTHMEWPVLLKVGALPMASLLSLGLMIQLFSGPGCCLGTYYLTGFELFGLPALFVFVACARLFSEAMYQAGFNVLKPYFHPGEPAFCWSFIGLLLLPQLAIAMLGGWLACRYQITISINVKRRRHEGDGSMLPSPGV
jgi:hypothetical protein